MKNHFGLKYARGFFCLQIITTLILTLCFGFLSAKAAWSALCGGIVNILPGIYFARKLFYEQRATASRQIVLRFYQGEAFKLLFSAMLFALVFLWAHVIPWIFFVAYITVQMMLWFAPLIFRRILK